ncbi:hypothetical protein CBS9595_002756 [Malassezia furfur]|nr:hypothetical protein CBS9595_002756 [Malassezia furfur]
MPSVVGDTSAQGWGRDGTSPLRRSARLSSTLSPRPARTDRSVRTPASESIARVRMRERGADEVRDASAWGSSLYSAASGARDPSMVSSFYLRPAEPDASHADADATGTSYADESSVSDVFSGLGSLLRGAQRPPQTPKSSIRHASHAAPAAEDYAQEDQFMEQVEDQWRGQRADADANPFVQPPHATNGVAPTPMRTPHVPGVFRSARRARRVDPNESQATDDTSVDPAASEAAPGARAAPVLGTIPRLMLLGALVVLVYWALFATSRVSLPSFGRPAAPPLVERPWRATSSSASVDELRKRIDTLEGAVNKIWRSFGDVGAEMKQQHAALHERLRTVEQRSALHSTVEALERQVQTLRAAHVDDAKRWADEKRHTESLLARLAVVEQGGGGGSRGAVPADAAASMRDKLAELEVRVARATRQAEHADAASSEAKQAVDALRSVVPDEIPVRYDRHTKRVYVDPAVYRELRKVLGTPSAAAGAARPESWAAFLEANRGALETLFAASIKEHLQARTASGLLLDRESFLALLQSELTRAKTELSTRFNENAQSLQTEILAKVRQQQDMYEQSGSWHKPAAASAWDSPTFLHDSVRASDGVAGLIDAALATYAADQIARADYAQYSAGARVVPSLTSPTHEVRLGGRNVHSVWSVVQALVPLPQLGTPSTYAARGRMPAVALHHDNAPGMCWPFSGSHGQLGIQLVRAIHVEAITIDHVPAVLALNGVGAAPREMEAWGVVQTPEERRKLAQWRAQRAHTEEAEEPTPVPPSPAHVYLGAFVYDAAGAAIQTFPVSSEGAAFPLPLRVVQLNVLSNHGLRDYTCLYRVRVHGTPAD